MTKINIALECFGVAVMLILMTCNIGEIKRKSKHSKTMMVMLGLNLIVLLCDMVTSCLAGMAEYVYVLYICNFFVYSIGYVITAVFTYYLVINISELDRISMRIYKVIGVLCAVAVMLVVVSLYNGMFFSFDNGIYRRGPLYWISQAYPICIIFVDIIIVLRHRKALGMRYTLYLMSYGFLPVVAMSIQIAVYGITLLYLATTLALLFIYISVHLEQSRRLLQKEKELSEAKISLMLSQIQPHFLFNVLTSIKELCVTDTKAAEVAIDRFSGYLRANMNSINQKECVTFENELEHVKNYLEIEKMRFNEYLNVKYDIQTTGFFIPVLTVQPLVENAVKHGIGGKECGGTVTISSYEDNNFFYVSVEDDGVGFEINDECDDGKSHIGINNVRERLMMMCMATVEIESSENVGTKAVVKIPKEKD